VPIERIMAALRACAILGVALLITIVALPSPTKSVAWHPLRAPNMEGPFAANDVLLQADRVAAGLVVGPEDVVVDDSGRVYSGTVDGKVIRTRNDGSIEVFAETGGRPLGMTLSKNGDLWVCDVHRGLLRIDPEGNIEIMLRELEGAGWPGLLHHLVTEVVVWRSHLRHRRTKPVGPRGSLRSKHAAGHRVAARALLRQRAGPVG
jgi:hypothetical protein